MGEALGEGPGAGARTDLLTSPRAEKLISEQDVHRFRLMAAHRDLWWPALAEKALSRKQVLTMIAEATGYENGTLRNAKWVSAKYELSARADNLSFKHHEIVAALPIEERTGILAKAARESWTCAELRRKKHTRLLSP